MTENSEIAPFLITRKIDRDGVTFAEIRYNSAWLQRLRKRIGPHKTVRVKVVDPQDIRAVCVFDPYTRKWVSVSYSDKETPS